MILINAVPAMIPGAGEYEYDREFDDNPAPKYSHGLPLPTRPSKKQYMHS